VADVETPAPVTRPAGDHPASALAHLDDPRAPAVTALRSRTLARFTELEDERLNTQLAELAKTAPAAGDPALLDALSMLGDLLADAPPRLQQQLYAAFDIQALYKKNMHQVTIHATITDSTPRAVAAITGAADDAPAATTSPADSTPTPHFSDLSQAPIGRSAALRRRRRRSHSSQAVSRRIVPSATNQQPPVHRLPTELLAWPGQRGARLERQSSDSPAVTASIRSASAGPTAQQVGVPHASWVRPAS
jgi:hypothetical protein